MSAFRNPFRLKVHDPCPYCPGAKIIVNLRVDGTFFCSATATKIGFWHPYPYQPQQPAPSADPHFPGKCPKCGGPAYQGITPGSKIDCKNKCGVA
jgi:hypothetical protein